MGCHESSSFQSDADPDIKRDVHRSVKQKDPFNDSLLEVKDPHCMEILNYIQSVEDEQWKLVIESQWLKIFKMRGSIFNEEAATSKIRITVEGDIPPKNIFRELNVPELRLKWDTNLEDLKIVKGKARRSYITYRKVNLFGECRDFYEKKFIGRVNGVPTCIAYSIDGKDKTPGVDRGITLMSVTTATCIDDQTIIEIVTQSDYTASRKSYSTALKINDWCSDFKEALYKYLKS